MALFAAPRRFAASATTDSVPPGCLSLYNIHNGERLSVVFRDSSGNYRRDALESLDWILRCPYTNEAIAMDVGAIEFLNRVDKRLGGDNEIHIISGYRSLQYNNLLRLRGKGVAQKSFHILGKAIDVVVPGHSLESIRKIALNLRLGGVGYYPDTGFVHLDSGPFRTW